MQFSFRCLILILAHNISISYAQNDSVAVNKVVMDYFDAIAAQDMTRQRELTTENYMILENGVIWNHDTIEYKSRQLVGKAFKRINKIDFIRTVINKNMGWVAYYNTANITIDGKQKTIEWLESAILVRKRKNWKIQFLHSTRLSP